MRATPRVTNAIAFAVVALAVVGAVGFRTLTTFREAKAVALDAYLGSVGSAVEAYRMRHGRYPADLNQIATENLDYDVGVPLTALTLVVTDSDILVSYTASTGTVTTFAGQ